MDRPIVALVLAGGTGTRLYPASRSDRPKQFLSFGGAESLLGRTVDRLGFADETYVLTRPAFADAVRDHAPGAGVLTEPEPKDTGPALAYAAARVREQVGDCVLLCVPSDHHVGGDFATPARRAARVASETGGIVTMGIEPTRPETGYGYIEPASASDDDYARVAQFREKPDTATARYLVDRGCYWNAGIFAWTPDALLAAARDTPLSPIARAADGDGDLDDAFDAVDPVSIDYAVMERADEVYVVPVSFDWDDLGAWNALERVLPDDGRGNAVRGETLAIDAEGNVLASDDKHVAAVGISDLVVAAYDDRVLVVPKDQAQRVREVVDSLESDGRF